MCKCGHGHHNHNEVIKLPTIEHNGKSFFVDLRLRELRQMDNPHNTINFSSIMDEELVDKVEAVKYEAVMQNLG